ncbi:MAG: hypothetical protein HOH19_10465 [Kordiimonadaceae bacterium]|jgi:uncharacterized protein|nr:hypothetical protein [Kordiimonadaceae bacterium]MBT6032989.1 hypothetical protein [Kordiimonadaceae bacterium]
MEFTEIKSSEEAFIAGYGDGGFRMGEQRFKGSMLITPSGFYPWDVVDVADITIDSLKPVFENQADIELLIIGMGQGMAFAPKDVKQALGKVNIAVEVMDTGAAARTYNVLLQEGRMVTAALIAI